MLENKNISVCFTADQFEKYADGKSTVVVVDLLRATSVISTAFMEGVEAIIPVQTLMKHFPIKEKKDILLLLNVMLSQLRVLIMEILPFIISIQMYKGKT